jgi:hypothetical protein
MSWLFSVLHRSIGGQPLGRQGQAQLSSSLSQRNILQATTNNPHPQASSSILIGRTLAYLSSLFLVLMQSLHLPLNNDISQVNSQLSLIKCSLQ